MIAPHNPYDGLHVIPLRRAFEMRTDLFMKPSEAGHAIISVLRRLRRYIL